MRFLITANILLLVLYLPLMYICLSYKFLNVFLCPKHLFERKAILASPTFGGLETETFMFNMKPQQLIFELCLRRKSLSGILKALLIYFCVE